MRVSCRGGAADAVEGLREMAATARRPGRLSVVVLAATAMLGADVADLSAQGTGASAWAERKCVLYERAVRDALEVQGADGLRRTFLDENAAFIASGCRAGGPICPVTDREIELANMLTILTMNEGMASTFVPFGCD